MSVPLSPTVRFHCSRFYCGAKFAVRGFTDSLRCELLHDNSAVKLVMVHLPAINAPRAKGKIEFIQVRREEMAAFMASAHARCNAPKNPLMPSPV